MFAKQIGSELMNFITIESICCSQVPTPFITSVGLFPVYIPETDR